jgi:gamma-glutamyltranspeptidase/glutathione hydrolase
MKKQFTLILLFSLLSAPLLFSQTFAKNGMVVSDNSIASQVGVDILKKGGNAMDATVATAFALAVTHPAAGNIGGGGFIVYMQANSDVTTIDFREKAPLAASPNMFQDKNGNLIPGSNHQGALSVGVPGTVAGLYMAHQKYGKLPWKELVQPSIDLAKNGFPLQWGLYHEARWIDSWKTKSDFVTNYYRNAKGDLIQPDELWMQPALATTLTHIRDKGRDGFYKGEVAKGISEFMKENGGIITEEDLDKYEAIERTPVKGTYKDFDIYSMAPPSSGGVTLIAMMNLMEQADLKSIEFNSAQYVHLIAETMRRAYADRAEFLGDPDFNENMPLDRLISKEHAKQRFANLDMTKASASDPGKYGHPYDGQSTTHFSVMDKDGNAVSLTYTLEHSYGAAIGSDKLGFIFNNEMGDFNPVPGQTTTSGQIGSDPNIIAPEKRMLSSMTPTIVAKDGKPYLVIGTPGGRSIINAVFQTVLKVLEYDMPIDMAIETMKINHQWLPDEIRYEPDKLSPDTRKALEAMGHNMRAVNYVGRMMGILVDEERGVLTGTSDSSSSNGAAVGY